MTIDAVQMGDEIARLTTAIDRATQRQLSLLRQFDDVSGWADSGATSCAAWLSWRTGMSPGAGRERVRVAHTLGELPRIDAAFADGELSYSKVRALCRVATPENEETLLGYARLMTGAELEKLVAQLRWIELAENAAERGEIEPERFYRQRTTDDGMVRLTIQVTADEAAAIATMLDDSAEAPSRRAEALVAIADERLRGDAVDRSPSEVVVHVDAGAITASSTRAARQFMRPMPGSSSVSAESWSSRSRRGSSRRRCPAPPTGGSPAASATRLASTGRTSSTSPRPSFAARQARDRRPRLGAELESLCRPCDHRRPEPSPAVGKTTGGRSSQRTSSGRPGDAG